MPAVTPKVYFYYPSTQIKPKTFISITHMYTKYERNTNIYTTQTHINIKVKHVIFWKFMNTLIVSHINRNNVYSKQ